jgi:hypothetical protein
MDAKIRGVKNNNGNTATGMYRIDPKDGKGYFDVWCDQDTDGGGWNVFQKRQDGTVKFKYFDTGSEWQNYVAGFGAPAGEYWLGLDRIARMTAQMPCTLRVDITPFSGSAVYAQYTNFRVGDATTGYRLTAEGFVNGGAGDGMSYHSGMKFSTSDNDQDEWYWNCAAQYQGAWWYRSCHYSNLNGLYYPSPGSQGSYATGVNWYQLQGQYNSHKTVQMKFR